MPLKTPYALPSAELAHSAPVRLPSAAKPFGLYVHVPFCSYLCHYCDFAKTARWDSSLVARYFAALAEQCQLWIEALRERGDWQPFTSLNFGGGTPSLFTTELAELCSLLGPSLAPGCELSLEANPKDITRERLLAWRAAGFNRISIGVQSLQSQGLAFLQRDHDAALALSSLSLAKTVFANVNVDLIYSWPGQSLGMWQRDLEAILALNPDHLSLYNLTYAPRTPIGRAYARGKIDAPHEEEQAAAYELACSLLAERGFRHEEVSNWSLEGKTCQHNWLYWQMQPYLGIGAGAHGYLPGAEAIGRRYSYPSSERLFAGRNLFSEVRWEARDSEAWLLEYVGSALRCEKGLCLDTIAQVTGLSFSPTEFVAEQMQNGVLQEKFHEGRSYLCLPAREWLRETAWSLALCLCFTPHLRR